MSGRAWMPWGFPHVPAGRPSIGVQGSGIPPGLPRNTAPKALDGVSDACTIPLPESGLNTTTEPGEPP